MPQFDILSFQSQIFWLFISFFFFYLFILKNFLPGFSAIRKIRIRRLFYLNLNTLRLTKESSLTKNNLYLLLRKL